MIDGLPSYFAGVETDVEALGGVAPLYLGSHCINKLDDDWALF
jgi:hypothetical protein